MRSGYIAPFWSLARLRMVSARPFALLGGVIAIACAFSLWSFWPCATKPAYHQQLRHSMEDADGVSISYRTDKRSSSTHGSFDPDIVDGVLQKHSFSTRMRLIFLVGLEGTGHHYMADVLDHTCKTAQVPCPKACNLAKALYPGLGNPKTRQGYQEARHKLREEMQQLALDATNLPEGKATIAGFGTCRFQVGMMSYPNFNGIVKTLQYVDFKLLAEEAERAGIDLRLIYMSRSARDILISDTKHNNYGDSYMLEARILLANAAVVESMFREVGPEFTTCFRYENMSDPEQAARVSRFVAPTNYAAQRLANNMISAVKTPSENTQARFGRKKDHGRHKPGEGEGTIDEAHEVIMERLQQKLDTIERDQCYFPLHM